MRVKQEKKKSRTKGIAYLGGSAVIGQQTIRSGIPRLLGVRLESHSTSKSNAKEILKTGYLDPAKGGTGASKNINSGDFISKSESSVHLTGRHGSSNKNKLVKDTLWRKLQRTTYRGISEGLSTKDNKISTKLSKLGSSLLTGALGIKGRTLYVGGSDNYFNKNFTPDPDDLGLKSKNKIKVYGNRVSATLEALKKEGGGNRLKGVVRLIKANPSRSLAGAGVLAVGSIATKKLGEGAYKNLIVNDSKVKSHTRKNKSGKWSTVKSFIRDKLKK